MGRTDQRSAAQHACMREWWLSNERNAERRIRRALNEQRYLVPSPVPSFRGVALRPREIESFERPEGAVLRAFVPVDR
jgi:hypothetical protein